MSVFKLYQGKRIAPGHPKYKSARWWVYKRLGKGRVIHETIPEAITKADAEIAERELIRRVFARKYGVAGPEIRFADFADTTYRRYVKQKNTNVTAKETDIAYLIRFFGRRKLVTEVTAQDCRDFQDWLLRKPTYENDSNRQHGKRSPSSVNRTMSTLKKILNLACEEGFLESNPMRFVAKLEEPPPRRRLLTKDQKGAFWNELAKDPFMFRIAVLGVNVPLRRGQILAITKESVDFENRTVLVVSSKGRASRPVPLNSAALRILTEMCNDVESGPLITFNGRKIDSFKTRWNKLLIRAKINKKGGTREENFHFHDLRTEFGSNLLKRNVNPEIINRLYAHSTMQITQGYIEMLGMGQMFDAVNSLDDDIQKSEVVQ